MIDTGAPTNMHHTLHLCVAVCAVRHIHTMPYTKTSSGNLDVHRQTCLELPNLALYMVPKSIE